MKKSITPNQIKQNNRNLIYHFIYSNSKVSQQEIAYALRLSRPTVTSNLTALEQDGLIQKSGQITSEYVGRKASAYSIVSDFRVGIGVEILRNEIKMIAIDLYGNKINRCVLEMKYKNEQTYYKEVCTAILAFQNSCGILNEQLLGIGFAMQALVSADGKTITYGKILSCTGLSIDAFSKYLPCPCTFIHDANSAAISEMWVSPNLTDGFYLSLSHHLGAALIANKAILKGKHGHSSTIEHISINPEGKLCYCGKRGCLETLCSMNALLVDNESPDDFFQSLRSHNPEALSRWKVYRDNLARMINMLHLVNDTDFILGGYLASYLQDSDIAQIHSSIQEMTSFEEQQDFIIISKMPKHNIAIGAALPFIQTFLNSLEIGEIS